MLVGAQRIDFIVIHAANFNSNHAIDTDLLETLPHASAQCRSSSCLFSTSTIGPISTTRPSSTKITLSQCFSSLPRLQRLTHTAQATRCKSNRGRIQLQQSSRTEPAEEEARRLVLADVEIDQPDLLQEFQHLQARFLQTVDHDARLPRRLDITLCACRNDCTRHDSVLVRWDKDSLFTVTQTMLAGAMHAAPADISMSTNAADSAPA